MEVIRKEVNEGPTANVKVSYLNNIIIVTMTESQDKHILALILTRFQQPEWKNVQLSFDSFSLIMKEKSYVSKILSYVCIISVDIVDGPVSLFV